METKDIHGSSQGRLEQEDQRKKVQNIRSSDEYKKIKKIKETLERENRDLKKSVYQLSYKWVLLWISESYD